MTTPAVGTAGSAVHNDPLRLGTESPATEEEHAAPAPASGAAFDAARRCQGRKSYASLADLGRAMGGPSGELPPHEASADDAVDRKRGGDNASLGGGATCATGMKRAASVPCFEAVRGGPAPGSSEMKELFFVRPDTRNFNASYGTPPREVRLTRRSGNASRHLERSQRISVGCRPQACFFSECLTRRGGSVDGGLQQRPALSPEVLLASLPSCGCARLARRRSVVERTHSNGLVAE
jgi:hypothetical protein